MDQLAREDITAAAAAHRELGRDYDGAVAEGLIERIGEEIDKRVDARLGQRVDRPGQDDRQYDRPPQREDRPAQRDRDGQLTRTAGGSWPAVVLALASLGFGCIATGVVLNRDTGGAGVLALIWIIIGVINVAYARRR
jgi:hypothetical protein